MKLLLDNCVWGKSRKNLAAAGYDFVHVGDWPQDPGDEQLLRRAYFEAQALVALDKDFGKLAVIRAQFLAGIIRLVEDPMRRQGPVCVATIKR